MRPSPLLTAVGASVGTFAVLGGATMVVSGIGLSVAKAVAKRHKLVAATPCHQCGGGGFVDCQVCMGSSLLRCRPPVSLRQLRQQRRKARPDAAGGDAAGGIAGAAPVYCACPACGATRQQRCLNCLGEGRVCLPG